MACAGFPALDQGRDIPERGIGPQEGKFGRDVVGDLAGQPSTYVLLRHELGDQAHAGILAVGGHLPARSTATRR